MEVALICLLGLAALAGVAFFIRVAMRLPVPAPAQPDYGRGDAVLATLLSLWFVYLVAQTFGQKMTVNAEAITASMVLYFCIVAVICGFLVGRGRNPVALFGLKWQRWQQGILFALGALLATYPVIALAMLVTKALGISGESQDAVLYLQSASTLQDRIPMIAMAVIVAPVAEETIFRGYLHGVIRKYGGHWCAIGVNSLLFAAIHGHAPSLGGLFVLAVALSLVYEHTGSLWAPIAMHATFNTITVVAALAWPDMLQ